MVSYSFWFPTRNRNVSGVKWLCFRRYYENKEIEAASKNLSERFGNLLSDPSKQGSSI